jgi:RNA polymerase sigma factor (sigma-70 family)
MTCQEAAVPYDTHADPDRLRALLRDTARHDPTAFRALYEAAAPRLYGFALRLLRRQELAEEALQEGFVAIWHAAGKYQPALSAPMTWMTTIVRNKALDIHRRQADEDAFEIDAQAFDRDVIDTLAASDRGPAEAHQCSAEARALAHCMALLERRQQQAIGLAFFHDLSHGEVAEQLALPLGTVKTWIRRGLDKLKTCLQRREAA